MCARRRRGGREKYDWASFHIFFIALRRCHSSTVHKLCIERAPQPACILNIFHIFLFIFLTAAESTLKCNNKKTRSNHASVWMRMSKRVINYFPIYSRSLSHSAIWILKIWKWILIRSRFSLLRVCLAAFFLSPIRMHILLCWIWHSMCLLLHVMVTMMMWRANFINSIDIHSLCCIMTSIYT